MVDGWPDAIACTVNGWGLAIFYLIHAPHTNNYLYYYRMPGGSTYDVRFNHSKNRFIIRRSFQFSPTIRIIRISNSITWNALSKELI